MSNNVCPGCGAGSYFDDGMRRCRNNECTRTWPHEDTPRPSNPQPDLAPPWVIFSDKGKPVAILPAGRPGEVANVKGVLPLTVQTIVRLGNELHDVLLAAQIAHVEGMLSALGAMVAQRVKPSDAQRTNEARIGGVEAGVAQKVRERSGASIPETASAAVQAVAIEQRACNPEAAGSSPASSLDSTQRVSDASPPLRHLDGTIAHHVSHCAGCDLVDCNGTTPSNPRSQEASPFVMSEERRLGWRKGLRDAMSECNRIQDEGPFEQHCGAGWVREALEEIIEGKRVVVGNEGEDR